MGIFKFFSSSRKKETSSVSFYKSLYPESVRYALRYKDAQMGIAEIRALVDGYTNEALYLVVKSIEDREVKRQFLQGLTQVIVDSEADTLEPIKGFLIGWIGKMPANLQVAGTKLAQLSRAGTETWQVKFHELAEKAFEENKRGLPCLIAHTAILGYRHFVNLWKTLPKGRLTLLVPDWMIDPEEQYMGYAITFTPEVNVTLQPKDRCLVAEWSCSKTECRFNHIHCGNSFFVDDTIHSGKTAGKITSFWHSEYGLTIPEDRIKVITDLRDTPHV